MDMSPNAEDTRGLSKVPAWILDPTKPPKTTVSIQREASRRSSLPRVHHPRATHPLSTTQVAFPHPRVAPAVESRQEVRPQDQLQHRQARIQDHHWQTARGQAMLMLDQPTQHQNGHITHNPHIGQAGQAVQTRPSGHMVRKFTKEVNPTTDTYVPYPTQPPISTPNPQTYRSRDDRGATAHSRANQANAVKFHEDEQRRLDQERLNYFHQHRVLRYYGDRSALTPNAHSTQPLLIEVSPNILKVTDRGILVKGLGSSTNPNVDKSRVTLLPWHRVHELLTTEGDPLWAQF